MVAHDNRLTLLQCGSNNKVGQTLLVGLVKKRMDLKPNTS